MKRGRLYAFVLELDPVDLLLIVSVAEYAVQVRNLLGKRWQHRQQLAAMRLPENTGLAGVDEPSEAKAASDADATDAGGDHATAGVPDYAAESDALAANLVSDGSGERYDGATRVRDHPRAWVRDYPQA